MKLSELIFKNPNRATATVATVAAVSIISPFFASSVASAASVSVASPAKTFWEWRIVFADRDLTAWFIPESSLSEVMENYPDGKSFMPQ
jgi:ABC-type Fe2+-enterobactin transport system substrate-binding protein